MRKSKKREKILSVFKQNDLLTPAEVVEKLSDIDPATVYRNINKFVEEGILREVKIRKGVSSYELNDDKHQHFICKECDKVFPIHIDEKDLKKILPEVDFEIDEIELNIKGRCKK